MRLTMLQCCSIEATEGPGPQASKRRIDSYLEREALELCPAFSEDANKDRKGSEMHSCDSPGCAVLQLRYVVVDAKNYHVFANIAG